MIVNQSRKENAQEESRSLPQRRDEAAEMLSISRRALDYLVANKQISIRRIGTRVLIPLSDLRKILRDRPSRAPCRIVNNHAGRGLRLARAVSEKNEEQPSQQPLPKTKLAADLAAF
jgi:excisionase family DNA binding protein